MNNQEFKKFEDIITGLTESTKLLIDTIETSIGQELTAEEFEDIFFKSTIHYLENRRDIKMVEEEQPNIDDNTSLPLILNKNLTAPPADIVDEILNNVPQDDQPQLCSVEGCKELAKYKGMCKKHYSSYYYQNVRKPKRCKVEGCNKSVAKFGYCIKHYNENKESWNRERALKQSKGCKIPSCNEKYYAKGYCKKHYSKLYKEQKKLEA